MTPLPLLTALSDLPLAGYPSRIPVGFSRLHDAVAELAQDAPPLRAAIDQLAADPKGDALLSTLFGNSPFLTECLIRDIPGFVALMRDGPDVTVNQTLSGLNDVMPWGQPVDVDAVMTRLRRAKRRCALTIALADIGGLWSLEQITDALSRLAEATLDLAVHAAVAASAGLPADPGLAKGYFLLGMGKLGAAELNYSSDIDLIALYDERSLDDRLKPSLQAQTPAEFYLRVTRLVVRLMEERTIDGYVFRTDLRLRPDPSSTPLAVSARTAERYYSSTALTWERAAFIKARPVAGDRDAAAAFLAKMKTFIWRKQLDFTAVGEIRDIRKQIEEERGGGQVAASGHNVKLGRGGIREIEFLAQVQQLLWGGRLAALRDRGTCPTLLGLVEVGKLSAKDAADLSDSYRFLRTAEHRLQMIDDQQTQVLPEDRKEFAAFAKFMGYARASGFAAALTRHLTGVARSYDSFFADRIKLAADKKLRFPAKADHTGTLTALATLGYQDPQKASATVRAWTAGVHPAGVHPPGAHPAGRSPRARALLEAIAPTLLTALSETADPDRALARMDGFFGSLRGPVRVLALLEANPDRLRLIGDVMGSAPALADQVEQHPDRLDSLILNGVIEKAPSATALAADLREVLAEVNGLEDTLDLTRRWVGDQVFLIAVAMLAGQIDPLDASLALSDIADCVIRAMKPAILASFEAVHGGFKDGAFAVLALGKLGGRELTLMSDLDLVFLYDAPAAADMSDGPKPLPLSVYYNRLAQRLISALTVPTAAGDLYEVDMRLRPSGNKGPVAIRYSGFVEYQREEAWTWEHMALTRTRVVSSDPGFAAKIEATIRDTLLRPRDPKALLRDVAEMREQIWEQNGKTAPLAIKHRVGGLVDIEFIAQYLLLRHAAKVPDAIGADTGTTLRLLGEAGVLSGDQVAQLRKVHTLWRRVQHLLRLIGTSAPNPADLSVALRRRIAEAAGRIDFEEAAQDIESCARVARALFDQLIAQPAAQLPAAAPSPKENA